MSKCNCSKWVLCNSCLRAAQESKSSAVELLERECFRLNAEVDRLKADVAEAKRREDKNAKACLQALSARDTLRAEVESLKDTARGLMTDLYNARAEVERLKAESLENDEFFAMEKPRLKRLLAERDSLQARLNGATTVIENTTKALVTTSAERDALKAHAKRLEEECIERANSEGELRQQLAGMDAENTKLADRNAVLTEQLAEAKADADKARRSWDALAANHRDLRRRIEALAANPKLGTYSYVVTADVLRDLLQPPKAETPLDVLARIEREAEDMNSEYGDGQFRDDLAKLRALVEKDCARD